MYGIGPFGALLTFFSFTVITVSGLLTPPLQKPSMVQVTIFSGTPNLLVKKGAKT